MSKKAQNLPLRRETSAAKRRSTVNRYVRIGLMIVGAIILIILAAGAVQVLYIKPSSPIAVVNGKKISTRDYQAMVRYNRFNLQSQLQALQEQAASLDTKDPNSSFYSQLIQQQIQQLQYAAASLPNQTLEDMIADELVRQEAAKRNIVASAEDVETQKQTWFGYEANPPTPTPTLEATAAALATLTAPTSTATPTAMPTATLAPGETPSPTPTIGPSPTPWPTSTPMTKEGYESLSKEYLGYIAKQVGFSDAAFQRLMETRVLRSKLQEALAAEIPASAPQSNIRLISVTTAEEANTVLQRIKNGEDFATVAKEVSTDASKDNGGEFGWVHQWTQTLPENVISRVLEMNAGDKDMVGSYQAYYVIEVVEKATDRPLDEASLTTRRSSALTDWVDKASQSDTVKRYWSSDKVPAAVSSS